MHAHGIVMHAPVSDSCPLFLLLIYAQIPLIQEKNVVANLVTDLLLINVQQRIVTGSIFNLFGKFPDAISICRIQKMANDSVRLDCVRLEFD